MKVRESIPTLGRESGFVDVYARAPLPNAELRTFAERQGIEYASAGMRVLSVAFDLIVIGVATMLFVLIAYGQTWLIYHGSDPTIDFYLSIGLIPLVYFVGFWFALGATPGKLLLNLRIVDAQTGQLPDLLQCLFRLVGYVLNALTLGLGILGICNLRKPFGWHDRLSGTLVIKQ